MSFLLTIELVPSTCWYSNVRSNVSKSEWDIIRNKCYKLADHKCEICGDVGYKQRKHHAVECHEIWNYDDKNNIQTLSGLIALCPNCHKTKHVGLAQVNGELDIVLKQLQKVNKITKKQASDYVDESFKTWKERSKYKWKLNIDLIKEYMKPENEEFIKKMDGVFKEILHKEEKKKIILIRNKNTKEVLESIDYSKIMFDADLNIFKKDKNGEWVAADSSKGFEAFIVQ